MSIRPVTRTNLATPTMEGAGVRGRWFHRGAQHGRCA